MSQHSPGDWKHLAEQASEEMNSDKLMELIDELNRVLGEHEETSRSLRYQGSNLSQDAASWSMQLTETLV